MKKFFTVALFMYAMLANAQNVGIGTPNPQNKLHVAGGFRLDTLTGVNGAGLLRHDANGVVYGIKFSGNLTDVLRGDGTFGSGGAGSVGWLLNGNSGTNPATNFIGTTDNVPLNIRVNNLRSGLIDGTSGNTGWGYQTLFSNTTGSINTALGYQAMFSNLTGTKNVAVGDWALLLNTSGARNTAVGSEALSRNVDASDNTAVGYFALLQNIGGRDIIGPFGIRNTAVGSGALYSNTEGNENTATGYNALSLNTRGRFNSAFGSRALEDNLSGNNSAFGYHSLTNNTTGSQNSAFGTQALLVNTTGSENTAAGYSSLFTNNGYYNSALGAYSLVQNRSGVGNTATGYKAMELNENGFFNTAIGFQSLQNNTRGYYNCALGYNALVNNSSSDGNVAVGASALPANTTGRENTAVGRNALFLNETGNNNIAIGLNSGTTSSFNNTVSIGNDGWLNGFSNQVFIGNASSVWIGGWKPWSVFSDARLKTDIKEDVHGLDFILRLRPVSYNQTVEQITKVTGNKSTNDFPGKYNADKIRMSGFLAQEVEKAAKDANYDFTGISKVKSVNEVYSMSYESFVIPLVKAVQEQQAIIEKQQKQIDDLLKRIVTLEKK